MDASATENVQVLGIGHLAAAVRMQMRAALGGAAELAPESIPPFVIACSDFPNPDSFRDANARALATDSSILFVAMRVPRVVLVGPLVAPGRAGCFECVCARRFDLSDAAPDPGLPGYARIGAGLAVREILARRMTPYKGTPDRRVGRRCGRCRACGSCSDRA
jgi:hypothetical protein